MLVGIDIGSMAVSAVVLDLEGQVRGEFYEFHKGEIGKGLENLSRSVDTGILSPVALTSSSMLHIEGAEFTDIQTSLIRASHFSEQGPDYILHVGAEKFYLIKRGQDGKYESSRTSTSCAAGTGSFLDQQSIRLNIPSIEEFCLLAAQNDQNVPEIASRCSVFAKTDLIHAQQEGYSPPAICDGLCKGLARNLSDTLFHDFAPGGVIMFTGGVSKNQVVARYMEEILDARIIVHPMSHLFGALGVGLNTLDTGQVPKFNLEQLIEHYSRPVSRKDYYYPPLQSALNKYPDFSEVNSYVRPSKIKGFSGELQVEIFEDPEQISSKGTYPGIYLGIDIGSTSTKAIICSPDNVPLLAYYTYTSGKPIEAVFSILEAFNQYKSDLQWKPEIIGVGTTGSGRKLIGKILNTDLILDEITAHARAAVHLEPDIDTIIEIGGQDAKFTILKHGEVVFSQMNAVCAAGTGSFIEEQAKKLGVQLRDYSDRVMNQKSPLTSDRCTVFMERDLNYLINRGYAVEELLAAVLHSVRENYFKKVAVEGMIGSRVCFQGATAKNKALVSAFEQRLEQEIYVSKYCHLTGALGVCITMKEDGIKLSTFRGIDIYKESIPVRTEICELCNNRCKLTIAGIQNDEVAFGFLCGRDYNTQKYKARQGNDFDLLKERNKIFKFHIPKTKKTGETIGIPSALHMFEERQFWEHFFGLLGIPTLHSNPGMTRLRDGKHLAGAEFCAPIESMYGHVKDLSEKVDFIFLPVMLESRERSSKRERNYCYYTQFSPSIVSQIDDGKLMDRFIIPEIDFSRSSWIYKYAIYKSLKKKIKKCPAYADIHFAWDNTEKLYKKAFQDWKIRFQDEFQPEKGLSVVLLGRPYIILSSEMNKSIPEYFSQRDVKCFFQDMLPTGMHREKETEDILRKVPWHFAVSILGSAEYIARTPGLYPVLVTAFKCAPDSFIIEFFKKILDAHNKPYLILQIDEHDSSVGYETRIEAGIRSFNNHFNSALKQDLHGIPEIMPGVEHKINGKTLLLPNWDNYSSRLLIAMLRRNGVDARALEPNETSMRKSMAHNKGQCTPVNIIAQDYIDYIEKYNLDPGKTLLWSTKSFLTCNIRMYPEYLKHIIESHGGGMEKSNIYLGSVSNLELSVMVTAQSYFVYMLGGLIRKISCMTRPYELIHGETDRVIENSLQILEEAFSGKSDLESAVKTMVGWFNAISCSKDLSKPEVAIFGDFYVQDHDIVNQGLVRFIENAGGVVVTTPYHDYVKLQAHNVIRRDFKRGDYQRAAIIRLLLSMLDVLDRKYYRHMESIIGMKEKISAESLEKHLDEFNVTPYQSGESYENLLKIFHILKYHPDLSLFVQANPAFCCPALITEAMTRRIKNITGVPVVTVTYDGTSENKNEILLPYLVAAKSQE